MPERLTALIDSGAHIDEIAALLDGLDPQSRTHVVTQLGRRHQRALYLRAEAAAPLTLEDFVPADTPAGAAVAHRGLNTLPMPHALKRFTKWMARTDEGIVGYNDSPFGPLIGPGYFGMRRTEGHEVPRGAVVVDYYQRVRGPVPEGWPWPRPNWLGIQVFVYFQTLDYMRRVSQHVTIGAAYKWNFALGSYFVLCREEVQPR